MSTNRRRRLSANTAEQLLCSRPPGHQADGDALASLLAAAAAPAFDRELAGEADAVAAFREAAHLSPANQPRIPTVTRSALTKLLAIKAAFAVAGVAAGGIALAAGTGHLPAQLGGKPAAAHSAQPSATASAAPLASGSSRHSAASPSPSLRGLCQAYTAGAGSNPSKALNNPASTGLIAAAGGKDKVAAFCTSMLAAAPSHTPTSHPTAKPSSLPTQAHGTPHPTGKPRSHSTGRPTSHP